jgi:hypothetical protein
VESGALDQRALLCCEVLEKHVSEACQHRPQLPARDGLALLNALICSVDLRASDLVPIINDRLSEPAMLLDFVV